jgi:hypothetical protein
MKKPLSDKQMQALYLRVIQEFKYKKLEIDKKIDEIVNKRITKIEKDCKKFKDGIIYLSNGYVGEKNKHGMPDGIGSLLFHSTEDVYVGQFDSGLKHGLGKYTYLSGDRVHHPYSIPYYAGEWFADSYHGLGKHLITEFEGLMIYEGTHTHDKKNGFGTYKKFNSDNVDKFCNTELIGYFFDGRGDKLMIEINRDDNGNLSQDTISGLFEYNQENGTKNPAYVFTKIEEWENLEPKKMEKIIADITYKIYESYFNLDPFTKKFSDLTIKIKKNVIKLMFDTSKYFEKNSNNKNYLKFLQKINSLNKVVTQIDENEKLIELSEMIEKEKKEFVSIEKKLKS